MTESSLDWNAFVHRALAAAALYGVLPRTPRVACGAFEDLGVGTATSGANVLVTIDAPSLEVSNFLGAREAVAAVDGVLAVVIASASAAGLVHARLQAPAAPTDAFGRAAAWAAAAAGAPLAPPASASRIRDLASEAARAGLALVEPELALLRTWPTRTAIDRAVLSTLAYGATARPLLFVDERRAPKAGLAKLRPERVLDTWLQSGGSAPQDSSTLFAAAMTVLANHPEPMRGKDLLQRARTRWTEAARSRGERATPSASDGPTLAKALVGAWAENAITIYAVDPAASLPLVRG
jgi:hypothetical protein